MTTQGLFYRCQMWTPPTPPQDDHDLYNDQSMCFLYEPSLMPESQLPPVYVKKEHKRIRVDPALSKSTFRLWRREKNNLATSSRK